jgi:hypothetical protein
MKAIATLAFALFALGIFAADLPKAPVPPSPYLPIIYKYADAMLEHGRDTYGPQKTGMFLSALDRATLSAPTNRSAAADLRRDENFLRLLYTLSDLSGKPKYRDAADAALRAYFENVRPLTNVLVPWGISWDVIRDKPITGSGTLDAISRPWMLWDRCFAVVPAASAQMAQALIENGEGVPAGYYIRTWATAYVHTKEERFLNAIETVLGHVEKKRNPKSGFIEYRDGPLPGGVLFTGPLSMAIDCDAASRLVPPPLSVRLQGFAAREDDIFCTRSHELKRTRGFITAVNHRPPIQQEHRTTPWTDHPITTAKVAMMCVSRYENTGDARYRDLIHAAAGVYLNSIPEDNLDHVDVWPMTFGHAISLQVAAWRSTAQQVYLDRARELADLAVKRFFDQGPLPRAGLTRNHYDALTGADTLALSLVELHLHILGITAVRYPPNTIDR